MKKISTRLLLIIGVICITALVCIFTLNLNNKNSNTYYDEKFKFYVDYPTEWVIEEIKYIEPAKDHNGSKNAGIKIFISNSDYIFVFGQVSYISVAVTKPQPFTTISGLSGDLYIENVSGRKDLKVVFNKNFIGAFVNASSECFDKNEKQIMDVLKSIRTN